MTVEISLPSPDPPRPFPTHSHIHVGPLVIGKSQYNHNSIYEIILYKTIVCVYLHLDRNDIDQPYTLRGLFFPFPPDHFLTSRSVINSGVTFSTVNSPEIWKG
jgi:hypothetical protein